MAQITEASERPILKSKIFLYITEFFSGMSADLLHLDQGQAHRLRGQRRDLRGQSCVSPLTGFAFWETNLAYEGESIYNYLQVKNLSDRTILSTNVLFGVQSVTMKDKGLTGMYYDTALAAPALADNANSALILGMGTGTYARQLKQYYPKMNITGVEIDQKITDLPANTSMSPPTSP